MKRIVISLAVLLCVCPFSEAGWLSDKLENAGKRMGDRFINDVSNETYAQTKEGAKGAIGPDDDPSRQKAEEVQRAKGPQGGAEYEDTAPPRWASSQQTVDNRKKHSSGKTIRTDLHFSADMEMVDPESSPDPITGKMFVDGARMRWDMSTPDGSVSTIITGAGPDDKIYNVLHGSKTYMTSKVGDAEEDFWGSMSAGDNPCDGYRSAKELGTKTVNGRSAHGWECREPQNGDEPSDLTLWIDSKLKIPLRSESSDGSRYELKNVRESKPPGDTFQLPPGYRPFSMGDMGR